MIKILVFDDDTDWLNLIAINFERAGITGFKLYDNYKEFIASIDRSVDVCLIDYAINGIPVNGVQLMREVHSVHHLCRVIMMSSYLDLKELNRCVINGAKIALAKDDYFFDDVVHAIKEIKDAIEIERKWKQ